MRLDSANRSFAALVISSLLLGVYVLCGAVGCVLVPLIVSRVSHHGVDGLVGEGHNLLPAVLFVVLAGGGIILGALSLVFSYRTARSMTTSGKSCFTRSRPV